MRHLTDDELERLADAPEASGPHVASCPACRGRLDEVLALRRRLKRAYGSVHADAALAEKVAAAVRGVRVRRSDRRVRPWLRRLAPSLAAAAALVLATVGLTLTLSEPEQAAAAPAELAQIHQTNLMPHAALHGSDDPAEVAAHLRRELGFVPALPRLGAGMALRGCCVAHFRNRPVGSYVLETDRGVMSVIVLEDRPGSLEFADRRAYHGRTYYLGAFARCKMAAVRIGDYTYTAVGETDVAWLVELLASLLDEPARRG
jgi:anti-sigma factor RsiW